MGGGLEEGGLGGAPGRELRLGAAAGVWMEGVKGVPERGLGWRGWGAGS